VIDLIRPCFIPSAVQGTFTYASTIDPAINDLYAKYAYMPNSKNLPIVLLMHGYDSDASSFTNETMEAFARKNIFACAVGLRGFNDAGGASDSSAREIYDIYDALSYIRTNFPDIVSSNRAAVVGYSSGGGNALACTCKFPDTWTDIVSHFGISDYGHDATYGWYQEVAEYRTTMETRIGGNPTAVPNAYYARAHVLALANYSGGHIQFFHDVDDAQVPVDQTQRAVAALVAAGLINYTARYTSSANVIRWLHAYPTARDPVHWTSDIWSLPITKQTHAVWTIPASGSVKVMGYIVTKRFSIWLGDGTAHAADVVYNTATDSYTVTPLTGEAAVTITQGAKTVTQTISEVTTLTVV